MQSNIKTQSRFELVLFVVLLPSIYCASYCNSTACYECHYTCLQCSGPLEGQCTTCTQIYIMNNGTCQSCSQNCISCTVTAQGSACQTCLAGYYLSQSLGTCNACSQGAQTCTFSAVQQCKDGYYLLNSVCFYCTNGCLACSNAYSCTLCTTGYYLTSANICSACTAYNCATCSQDGPCSLCLAGFSGTNCSDPCPSHCDICSFGTCYQCSSGYFMDYGICRAMSILCSQGSSYGTCYQCKEGSVLLGSQCYPYPYTQGTHKQQYFTALNTPAIITGTLSFCPAINLYFKAMNATALSLSFTVGPIYQLKISIQILTEASLASFNLVLSSSTFKEIITFTVQGTSKSQSCLNVNLTLSNFQTFLTPNFSQAQNQYSVQLTLQNQNSSFLGVSQLVVEELPCAVKDCGLCLSAYTCQHCLPGFYLQNNLCLSACSQGYYMTEQLQTCTITCPQGYYPILSDYLCQACVPPCSACTTKTSCSSCQIDRYLLGTQCLTACPSGYFPNTTALKCSPCRYPCQDCVNTSETCTSCSLGYLSGLTCLMECPAGKFADLTALACSSCSSQCSTCKLTPEHCISCPSGLSLQPNATCLLSCDSGLVSVEGACLKCTYPCATCSAATINCTSCSAGYLAGFVCVNICPDSTYPDASTRVCQNCPNQCSLCLSAIQCSTCTSGYYLYSKNLTCLASCPDATFPNISICQPCSQPCSTCDSSGCLSCQGYLFVLHDKQCRLDCPPGTYLTLSSQLTKICSLCGQNCLSCLSISQCLTCSSATLLQGGLCTNSCLSGSYGSQGVCKYCVFPCLECVSSDRCLSCQTGYIYYSVTYSCLRTCPSGTFNNSSQCLPCLSICQACKDASSSCLLCAGGYYKSAITSVCQLSCEEGYYSYQPLRVCKQCASQCKTCSSQSTCLSCYLNSTYPYSYLHTCLASCPSGYFHNLSSICEPCSSSCTTCITSSTNCKSCPPVFVFTPSQGTCTDTCPLGYYDSGSGTCLVCISPCKTCLSPSVCLSCDGDLALHRNLCLTVCPTGFFSVNNSGMLSCSRCGDECLTCSVSSSTCQSCLPPKYLSNNTCIDQCSVTTYPDSITTSCLACISPCSTCFSASKCKSCVSGYYLYQQTCLVICPSGYYSIPNTPVCQVCQSPCASCSAMTVCTACISGHYLDAPTGTCIDSCPSGTYSFSTSNGVMQCLSCSSSCQQCYDSTACKSCITDSVRPYLQGTVCQSSCTEGYYSILGSYVCQACSLFCVTCTSGSNCLKCSSAYLFNGSCYLSCLTTHYPSLAFTCQICVSPCLECYDSANCKTCVPGYYLYLTHCLQTCPPDQWSVTSPNICNQTCLQPYFRMDQQKICTLSCALYHSSDGSCLSLCPGGLIANESWGCQSCSLADCLLFLEYQIIQQQLYGSLQLVLVFNLPIDVPEHFQNYPSETLTVELSSTEAASEQEINVAALRELQQRSEVNFKVIKASIYSVTIELETGNPVFSGQVLVSVNNLTTFTTQRYPVQSTNKTIEIQWYQSGPSSSWTEYLAYILSAIFLLCLIINFIFDNAKIIIPLTDVLQTLHFLFYLEAWCHPALTRFMLGFKIAALRMGIVGFGQTLWNCPSKSQIVYGGCSLFSELLLPLLFLLGLIIINIILSRMKYFSKRHMMSWGHAYILWWLCSPSLAVSSFTYIGLSGGIEFIIAVLISCLFGLVSLIIGFQVIKNVYNKSYAERTFFWNIKKKAGELGSLHALLLVVRRVCLVIGVGVAPQSPLGCLFILTLLTVYIVSNMLINKALRKMPIPQILSQILFGVFVILLQMSIVNATTIQNTIWNALGWIMFLIAFLAISILTVMTCMQTYQCLRLNYGIIRTGDSQKSKKDEGEEASQSHTSEQSKQSRASSAEASYKGKKEELKKSSGKRSDDTQQYLRMTSEAFSPKARLSGSGFSDILEGFQDIKEKAPEKLIKLKKQEQKTQKID